VSIDSTLKLFGKIFPENDAIEKNVLGGIIENLVKNIGFR
jgi:hypothetical protein